MKTINIHKAKTELSAVLAEIEQTGKRFTICRNGRPIADLVPHVKKNRLTPHPTLKKIKVHGDLTKPMTEEDWNL